MANFQEPLARWVQEICKNGTPLTTVSRVEILAVLFIFAVQTYAWDRSLVRVVEIVNRNGRTVTP